MSLIEIDMYETWQTFCLQQNAERNNSYNILVDISYLHKTCSIVMKNLPILASVLHKNHIKNEKGRGKKGKMNM